MITKLNFECYLNLETEGKINFLLTSIQWFFTQKKVSLILTKTLSFPQKTAYFLTHISHTKMQMETQS